MVEVDRTDLTILRTLEKEGYPMWKKDIHRTIQNADTLPAEIADVSVQTIGRRIDNMHEAGLLKPRIVTPQNINRDLIIAYETTEKGKDVITEKREHLLRKYVYTQETLQEPDDETHIYLADLFSEEIGLDEEGQEPLWDCHGLELAAVIAAYCFQQDLEDIASADGLEILESHREKMEPLRPVVDWIKCLD